MRIAAAYRSFCGKRSTTYSKSTGNLQSHDVREHAHRTRPFMEVGPARRRSSITISRATVAAGPRSECGTPIPSLRRKPSPDAGQHRPDRNTGWYCGVTSLPADRGQHSARCVPDAGPGPRAVRATTGAEGTENDQRLSCGRRRSTITRARARSPPAAARARRAHSQSPAHDFTSRRSSSTGYRHFRILSSGQARSHVRQIESSEPQSGQVLRRRRRQTRPHATHARRCLSRQSCL